MVYVLRRNLTVGPLKYAVVVKVYGGFKGFFKGFRACSGYMVHEHRREALDELGDCLGNGIHLSRTDDTQLFEARDQSFDVTPLLLEVPKLVLELPYLVGRT